MAVPRDRWDWGTRVDSGKLKLSAETAERMGHSEVSSGIRGRPPAVTKMCLAGSSGSDCAHPVQNGTVLRLVLPYCIKMRKSNLTAKEWSSVPCPTCGVAPGEPCLLPSGALRTEPHVDRKLSAAEALEANRIRRGSGRR